MTHVQLLLPQSEYDTLLSAVNQVQGQASEIHIELDDGAHAMLLLRCVSHADHVSSLI
jgi:hypothetical protein